MRQALLVFFVSVLCSSCAFAAGAVRTEELLKVREEQYQAWKSSLSLERQKWEALLEENLGGHYLPLHKKDKLEGRQNEWEYVEDDPKLPRVLLIGDSISLGYTLPVRKALAGKANVHRAPTNCGATPNGKSKLSIWLGSGKWDVIHFNFGIHDRNTKDFDYEKNLEEIVTSLEKTNAKLIWATSTPVPADSRNGEKYTLERCQQLNAIALKVMQRHDVLITDLYSVAQPKLKDLQLPNNVHFNVTGHKILGDNVAVNIQRFLYQKGLLAQ